MKRSRSTKFILSFLLLSLITISGCDTDDDEKPVKPEPDNHIVIQGKKYLINDVILRSNGPQDIVDDGVSKNTHYSFSLFFSDGQLTIPNGPSATNSSYIVVVTFCTTIADHTEKFTGGEFEAIDPSVYFRGEVPEFQNFFTTFLIRIDVNRDSKYEGSSNDIFMDASIGTISATGSEENFSFTFENTINNPDPNTPVTGMFEGTVELMFD